MLFSSDGFVLHLFNDDKVYQSTAFKIREEGDLPRPKSTSNVFLWSLFDTRGIKEPEPFLTLPPCLPVQATLPDPGQYKTWHKELFPLVTGLPLWTREELVAGYVLPMSYIHLGLNALYKVTVPA